MELFGATTTRYVDTYITYDSPSTVIEKMVGFSA